MQTGVKKLYSGTEKLSDSMKAIKSKFDSLEPKVGVIQKYISEMYEGSVKLFNGVNIYTGAVGEINKNVEKIQYGATQLAKGSSDLDNGVGRLKYATGKMKVGTKKLDNIIAQKDELLNKSSQLSQGLTNLGNSYGTLLSGIEQISKKSTELKNSTQEFNSKLHQVENSIKNLNSNISLENDIKNLEAKANNIQKSQEENEEVVKKTAPNFDFLESDYSKLKKIEEEEKEKTYRELVKTFLFTSSCGVSFSLFSSVIYINSSFFPFYYYFFSIQYKLCLIKKSIYNKLFTLSFYSVIYNIALFAII